MEEKHKALLGETWTEKLEPALKIAEDTIYPKLKEIKDTVQIYPSGDVMYRAFKECPYEDVKVIIIGQDPYYDEGSALGIAFDNPRKESHYKISPSLRNILSEINDDDVSITMDIFQKSYLGHWPSQGVLMLNTALTVEASKPGSHAKLWEDFTKEVISVLNKKDNIVWVLWGAHALSYKDLITNDTHSFVISSHPSPLAANKPLKSYPAFKGSNPFSKINKLLESKNLLPIEW